jgi:hypothetical protein
MDVPAPDGFSVREAAVRFTALPPTEDLADVVHCFSADSSGSGFRPAHPPAVRPHRIGRTRRLHRSKRLSSGGVGRLSR